MKVEEELVYKYDGYINVQEYKKMIRNFQNREYWRLVISGTILPLFLCSIISIIFKSFLFKFLCFFCPLIIGMIYFKVRFDYIAEKTYLSRYKDNGKETRYIVEFYKDYLIRISDEFSIKIYYKDIEMLVETETNVYLDNRKNNIAMILLKDKCSKDIIEFLKRKVEKSEKRISSKRNQKTRS